jgi:hypothetical protein
MKTLLIVRQSRGKKPFEEDFGFAVLEDLDDFAAMVQY